MALTKKDGGICPISVGYTLRRLVAKCANNYVIKRRSEALQPRSSSATKNLEMGYRAEQKQLFTQHEGLLPVYPRTMSLSNWIFQMHLTASEETAYWIIL